MNEHEATVVPKCQRAGCLAAIYGIDDIATPTTLRQLYPLWLITHDVVLCPAHAPDTKESP